MDSNGGDLQLGGIELQIPCGAIAKDIQVDISLEQLAVDASDIPFSNHMESRISPIVYCRPPGTIFNKHCSLSFPHNAVHEDFWEFTLLMRENFLDNWKKIEGDDKNTTFTVRNGRCYIQTNHFTQWFLLGKLVELCSGRKKLTLGLFGKMLKEHYFRLRVRIWSDHDYKLVEEEEMKEDEKALDIFKPINAKFLDIEISIGDLLNGWEVHDQRNVTLADRQIWTSRPSHGFLLKLNDASMNILVATVSCKQGLEDHKFNVHTVIQHISSTTDAPHPSSAIGTSHVQRPHLGTTPRTSLSGWSKYIYCT
ncbi:UNC5C-like protein [Anneissia japonica]|uniref:UNC5C-like protein n=1 Tax=Anneissia japonica TaxID=1529436 RepID=UPI001425A952|nr:UNC5C-like protein [Anneissia japonica]